MRPIAKQAFTLVELAIVLVIIGLLVGGVLVGSTLIHAAELRAVVGDVTHYTEAVEAFRNKYNGYPGDLKNATSFFGVAGGNGSDATCRATTSTTGTCNGDGDGRISYDYGTQPNEGWRAWQQLGMAKMIAGTYTGVGAPGAYVAGTNVPKARINNDMWALWWFPGRNAAFYGFAPTAAGHFLTLGNAAGGIVGVGSWINESLTPMDAYTIDSKMDDGLPFMGKVNAVHDGAYNPYCYVGFTDTSPYETHYGNLACDLFFEVP